MAGLWHSFQAWIRGIWKFLTSPFWLFNKLRQLFADKDSRQYALDIVKTIISAASLIATVIAAIGLFVNYQDAIQNRLLTQERLITDRFTKAVEQIGNSKEEVVIGGIYSLERITKDSPKDQWTIMEVLTAMVRKNSPIPEKIKKLDDKSEDKIKTLEQLESVNIQVQAALTVIGRRNPDQDNTQEDKVTKILDLSESNLSDANLENANLKHADLERADLRTANLKHADLELADLFTANLERADLRTANLEFVKLKGADLERANLEFVKLKGANLESAHLKGANLKDANLESAYLKGANLKDANLKDANLELAHLKGANLESAHLKGANLERAKLSNTQIKSACFWESAIFTESDWNEKEQKWVAKDEQANQQKIEQIRQDKASDPTNPPDCPKWKR